jgi:hypothetical protein
MGLLDSGRDEKHDARQMAQGGCSSPASIRAAGVAVPTSTPWLSDTAPATTALNSSLRFLERHQIRKPQQTKLDSNQES